MTPSELAELTSQLEFSKRCRWKTNRSYCSPVIREEDVDLVLKSLRFAADMERLWRECPNNVTVYHGGLQDTPAWITAGLFREKDSLAYVESGFHADIYAAARIAVEKLEGK